MFCNQQRCRNFCPQEVFPDNKRTVKSAHYSGSKGLSTLTTFCFSSQQVVASPEQQTIIRLLDRFMEALLSDKNPCHLIPTAVMMNMIRRGFCRWESCFLYMLPLSLAAFVKPFPNLPTCILWYSSVFQPLPAQRLKSA